MKQTGKVIGYLLCKAMSPGAYEMGWLFNRRRWRQGYAYEACSAWVDSAFCEDDAQKIFAETIDTVQSVPLMQKLGMTPEGIEQAQVRDSDGNWADLHLYGLLREAWKARQTAIFDAFTTNA